MASLIVPMIARRVFFKSVLLTALAVLVPQESKSKNLHQRVMINVPAYKLFLISDGKRYHFDVAVGKKDNERRATPIGEGVISEKRKRIVFRYGEDIPQLHVEEGQKIIWTHTFDSHGKPVTYKMPYERMRGLAMEIKEGHQWVKDFVIHSTTDEYTIRGPASDGCIRLKMDDMLKLYHLVAPGVQNGKLKRPVPLSIQYRLVEVKDGVIHLHANLYDKKVSYAEELEKQSVGQKLDYKKFDILANEEEIVFRRVLHRIRSILRNDWPKNYVPERLKKQLHRQYRIEDFSR